MVKMMQDTTIRPFESTCMVREMIILSEVKHTGKHIYQIISFKRVIQDMTQMNICMKQKDTPRYRE